MNVYAKDFVAIVNDAAKKSSRAKLFDDFLTCATAALNRDETAFAAVDNKDLHATLLAKLMAALDYSISEKVVHDKALGLNYKVRLLDYEAQPKYRDILGEIFHALELFDQGGGQVFTPQHVADIMGETTLTAELIHRELDTQGFVTIKENCCGSGALILGSLNALLQLGINPCRFALVHASDLDERCIKMTFIQLSLYAIPGVVMRQDAISGQIYGEPLITPILYGRRPPPKPIV